MIYHIPFALRQYGRKYRFDHSPASRAELPVGGCLYGLKSDMRAYSWCVIHPLLSACQNICSDADLYRTGGKPPVRYILFSVHGTS